MSTKMVGIFLLLNFQHKFFKHINIQKQRFQYPDVESLAQISIHLNNFT